jgi:hypothetical protein
MHGRAQEHWARYRPHYRLVASSSFRVRWPGKGLSVGGLDVSDSRYCGCDHSRVSYAISQREEHQFVQGKCNASIRNVGDNAGGIRGNPSPGPLERIRYWLPFGFCKVVLCGVGGNQHLPQDRFKLSLGASRDKN